MKKIRFPVVGKQEIQIVFMKALYMNSETGEFTFPKDAIIPEQTEKDREILPKFIITGKQKLDDKDIDLIKEYLEKSYKQRNETKRY